jgi:hypothetical protein
MRVRAASVVLGLTALGLSACGEEAYASVTELREALDDKAGVACPALTPDDLNDPRPHHGLCSDPYWAEYEYEVAVFDSNGDRDEAVALTKLAAQTYCVAYGQGWAVTFRGEMARDSFCDAVAEELNGELVRGGVI